MWQRALKENSVAAYAAVLSAAKHVEGVSKVVVSPEQAEAVGKLLSAVKAPSGKARRAVSSICFCTWQIRPDVLCHDVAGSTTFLAM